MDRELASISAKIPADLYDRLVAAAERAGVQLPPRFN